MMRIVTGQTNPTGDANAASIEIRTDDGTEDAGQHETVCVIVNPRAGGWRHVPMSAMSGDLEATVKRWLLCHKRYASEQIQVHLLREANGGARLARAAIAAGCRTLVAVGGDGTVNDILQGVMASGRGEAVTLGLIPMGTANVLASVLGLPVGDPSGAARIVCEAHTRRIDVGQTQSRRFVPVAGIGFDAAAPQQTQSRWCALVAGVGFDAAATQRVNARLKRRVGELAYVAAAFRLALRYPRQPVRLHLDGEQAQTFDAYLVVIANGGQWGGRFRLGANVRPDDGLLDVYVCERRGPLALSVLRHGLALLQNRFEGAAGVQHFQARDIVVNADAPLPVQLDGDAVGSTPLHVQVVPNALRVFAPENRS